MELGVPMMGTPMFPWGLLVTKPVTACACFSDRGVFDGFRWFGGEFSTRMMKILILTRNILPTSRRYFQLHTKPTEWGCDMIWPTWLEAVQRRRLQKRVFFCLNPPTSWISAPSSLRKKSPKRIGRYLNSEPREFNSSGNQCTISNSFPIFGALNTWTSI